MENFKKKIKLIKRNLKYKGTIMDVYSDMVEVDGNITNWDFVDKCNASAIIPVLPNRNIVMVRQYRLAVDKWTLELPAGKVDENEDFLICAKRELEEETGYKSEDLEFLCDTYTAAAFCSEIVRIYVAKNLVEGIKHFDRDEELVIEEWALENLKQEIYKGNIKDGKTIAGIMTYISKIKNI